MVAEDTIETCTASASGHLLLWWRRQTHSLIVEQEYLHLGRGGAGGRRVPDRHHLGDVAGDGLYNVHGGDWVFGEGAARR